VRVRISTVHGTTGRGKKKKGPSLHGKRKIPFKVARVAVFTRETGDQTKTESRVTNNKKLQIDVRSQGVNRLGGFRIRQVSRDHGVMEESCRRGEKGLYVALLLEEGPREP